MIIMPRGIYIKSEEHKRKIGETLKSRGVKPNTSGIVNYWLGKKRVFKNPEERKRKISLGSKGRIVSFETRQKMSLKRRKENHWNWKKDRSLIVKSDNKHKDSNYRIWRLEVRKRDNFKCRINNGDCKGRLESHHILSWRNYPELRYEVNNGITLCHSHHPRKRNDEMRLSPFFIELVKIKM